MEELKKAVKQRMDEMDSSNIVFEKFAESTLGFMYDVIAKICESRYRIFTSYKSKVTGDIHIDFVTVNEEMLKAMSLR
jgi:hypothetical protein